jgi:ribonuclease Z
MFSVTILGNNSAVPAYDRHPTSQVVSTNHHTFLVDCGEGAQIQMMKYKIRRSRISHIFISHLHGDHFFGLAGLITSFGLLGRTQDLHIFSPGPLKEIIELQLKAGETLMPYQLFFHSIQNAGVLLDEEKMKVECFKTTHRIECYGFKFTEKKKPRKIDGDKIKAYDIPATFYERLKEGADYTRQNGEVIKNEWVTEAAPHEKIYAYCGDTRYEEKLVRYIKGADLVYHETTYLDNKREIAESRFHSTSRQAAELAKKAGVGKLLIGHFSSRYEKLDDFETEAREVFENTFIATEGVSYFV